MAGQAGERAGRVNGKRSRAAWTAPALRTAGDTAPIHHQRSPHRGERPVSGVNVQKFIIFMAAIIFAAAGLLIGMSYKELFPPSEKNTRAVQVQPVTTADREETAVAKEPATPEKAAATEKTPTPRESESQEDKTETAPAETAPPEKPQTADNQEKRKSHRGSGLGHGGTDRNPVPRDRKP